MATVDSAKEEVGWLKVLFAVFAAIDASLVAWIFQTGAMGRALLLLAIAGAAVSSILLMWLNHLAYRRIRQLETL